MQAPTTSTSTTTTTTAPNTNSSNNNHPNDHTTHPPSSPSSSKQNKSPRPFKPYMTSSMRTALKQVKSLPFDTRIRNLSTDLITGKTECVICMDPIRPKHKIWSCPTCYTPVHLPCLIQWSKSSSLATTLSDDVRCPACNTNQPTFKFKYVCFCTKTQDPVLDKWTVPHACTGPCTKQLACQIHFCALPCHPGPCSACTRTVTVKCPGNHISQQSLCGSLASKTPLTCSKPCAKLLNCQIHRCTDPCHLEKCSPCSVLVTVACMCGQSSLKHVNCGSEIAQQNTWMCETKCRFEFPCHHSCPNQCCTSPHTKCPYVPSASDVCPCGQTKLNRNLCSDPLNTVCHKPCRKTLTCGHTCSLKCHQGPCKCLNQVSVTCRCTLVSTRIPCTTYTELFCDQLPFTCDTPCAAQLTCLVKGHKCRRECCPANPKLIHVPSTNKPSNKRGYTRSSGWHALTPTSESADQRAHFLALEQVYHQCPKPCSKLLKCQAHRCPRTCHQGMCSQCLEATFDELFCACGRSSLVPPIPCGTTSVECPYPCTRPQACGHMIVSKHTCHPDTVPCPPCPVPVNRTCACGKNTNVRSKCCLVNCPPKCSQKCGLKMQCGHACLLGCHDPSVLACVCKNVCLLVRMECGHHCALPCHWPEKCTDIGACMVKVSRTCNCGRLSMVKVCVPNSNTVPLECDATCMVLLRNKQLKLALSIDPTHVAPPLVQYPNSVLAYYKKNKASVDAIEHSLIALVHDLETQRVASTRFKPGRKSEVQFMMQVANIWHVNVHVLDSGQYVEVTGKQGCTQVPMMLLKEACEMHDVDQAEDCQLIPSPKVTAQDGSPTQYALLIRKTLLTPADLEPYLQVYIPNPMTFSSTVYCPSQPYIEGDVHDVLVQLNDKIGRDEMDKVCFPVRAMLLDVGQATDVDVVCMDVEGKIVGDETFQCVVGKRVGNQHQLHHNGGHVVVDQSSNSNMYNVLGS